MELTGSKDIKKVNATTGKQVETAKVSASEILNSIASLMEMRSVEEPALMAA